MICLSGPNHTIGVFRKDNHNYIFDSNYNHGQPKKIEHVSNLKNEIIRCLFRNKRIPDRKLPIEISITTENMDIDHLPDKMDLYRHLLDENKNDLDKPGIEGITNLYLACESGDIEEVRVLIASGADVNQPCKRMTPLMLACEKGYTAIAKLLIDQGAPIDQVDKDVDTPLHVAVNSGHEETVKMLLENGANPINCRKAKTPLQCALENHEWNVIVMILSHLDDYQKITARDRSRLLSNKKEVLAGIERNKDSLNILERENIRNAAHALNQVPRHQSYLFTTRQTRAKKPPVNSTNISNRRKTG